MQSFRPKNLANIRKLTYKFDLSRKYSNNNNNNNNNNDSSTNNDIKSVLDKEKEKGNITALTISNSNNKIYFNCYKCGVLCTNLKSSVFKYSKCAKCNNSLAIFSNEIKTQYMPNIQTYPSKQSVKFNRLPGPKTICQFLDKYIIGQDNSKKVISVAVYNHYKKINTNLNKSTRLDNIKTKNSDYSIMKFDDSKITLKGFVFFFIFLLNFD